MKYFFTSDTHFGHKNIIEYCQRPFKSVEEMNEKIIENWNKVVSPEDTVFHLGDFVFRGKKREFLHKLNGKVIWLKGNHDSRNDTPIREMFIKLGGIDWHLVHNPADSLCTNVICGHVHQHWKFKKIKDRKVINVGVDVWGFTPITIDQIMTIHGGMENAEDSEDRTCSCYC